MKKTPLPRLADNGRDRGASSNPPRFYGHGIPGVDLDKLAGKLIVVEGADGSGRSTQIARLVKWLEASGHATVQVGLKRSTLVSEELEQAQHGTYVAHDAESFLRDRFRRPVGEYDSSCAPSRVHGVGRSLYLHVDGPRSGARRDEKWLRNLYGIALVPDVVFYLNVSPEELVQRNFEKNHALDYWESGMDLGLSRDMFDSFLYSIKRSLESSSNGCNRPTDSRLSMRIVRSIRLLWSCARKYRP